MQLRQALEPAEPDDDRRAIEALVTARKLSAAKGLERTLRAIAGRLDDSHAALVALARGLAAAVDAEPGNAALWREYRAAVVALGQITTGEVDDDTAKFLVSIRTPTQRRDEED